MAILEGKVFALGFGEGGHRKKVGFELSTLSSSSLLLVLDLDLDLELNGGERKLDPDQFGSGVDSSFSLCARSSSWTGQSGYKIPRAGNDLTFLRHVTKFIVVAKKHRTSLGRERTICPCNRCKNNLVHEDSVVKSHLICYGFVDN